MPISSRLEREWPLSTHHPRGLGRLCSSASGCLQPVLSLLPHLRMLALHHFPTISSSESLQWQYFLGMLHAKVSFYPSSGFTSNQLLCPMTHILNLCQDCISSLCIVADLSLFVKFFFDTVMFFFLFPVSNLVCKNSLLTPQLPQINFRVQSLYISGFALILLVIGRNLRRWA